MSTTRDPPTVECNGPNCHTLGRKWQFHHGKYCSNICELRREGREALARLIYDHTCCCSCFRQLKTINPPKPDFEFTKRGYAWTLDEDGAPSYEFFDQTVSKDSACGFQFLTEHAGKGEKQRNDRVITGTICEHCGNTDHRHHNPALADREAIGRLVALFDAEDNVAIDVHQLHHIYERHPDLELAVGIALQD